MRRFCSIFILLLIASHAAAAVDPTNPSGLKIPRFAALRSGDVNVRAGPGTRYPIQWIYHREGLPVEIIAEFEQWRKIRDSQGSTGWVHRMMLNGKRFAVIKAREATFFDDADDNASRLFKAEPKVMGRLLECNPSWCRMQVDGHKGWVRKQYLWGVYPDEIIK